MFNEVNNLAKIANKVRYFVSVADQKRQAKQFVCRFCVIVAVDMDKAPLLP